MRGRMVEERCMSHFVQFLSSLISLIHARPSHSTPRRARDFDSNSNSRGVDVHVDAIIKHWNSNCV